MTEKILNDEVYLISPKKGAIFLLEDRLNPHINLQNSGIVLPKRLNL